MGLLRSCQSTLWDGDLLTRVAVPAFGGIDQGRSAMWNCRRSKSVAVPRVERYAGRIERERETPVFRHLLTLLCLSALAAGCNCRPELPDANPDDVSETTTDTAPPPIGDTAPPPPCDVPETEDNGSPSTANLLPMEVVGCGQLQEAADFDYWDTTVPADAWVRFAVVSRGLGAIADVHLLVVPEGEAAAKREDDEGTTDASLLFPAKAGDYSIAVSEQNFNGDSERYEYELVVSTSKAPLEWDRYEVEPNDDHAGAQQVFAGEVLFGDMQGGIDNDWYWMDVPSGKHTLTVTIEAYAYGSAGNFSLWLYDAWQGLLPAGCDPEGCGPGQPNCVSCEVMGPPVGFARDPILEYESLGSETLYWRVVEFETKFGEAYWYTMRVDLEGT